MARSPEAGRHPAARGASSGPGSCFHPRVASGRALLCAGAVLLAACSATPEPRSEREDILVLTKRMVVLTEAGKYEEARPVAQRAVRRAEETLGPEHPTVAIYLTYLGGVQRSLGEHEDARATYEKALAMQGKLLGADHVAVSNTLSALARLDQDLGRDEQARASLLRALAIREQALGPEHPATVTVVCRLGALYERLGDYENAEPLLVRALDAMGAGGGRSHPERARTMQSYVRVLRNTGRSAQADELEARGLPLGP